MTISTQQFEHEEGITSINQKKWSTALYIRLSREDGDKLESDSVKNQKAFLTQFIENKSEFSNYTIWTDDGHTGTNFKRPSFISMMEEIKSGLINCVIVKDLSRFGRNLIETSTYLEDIFPKNNCRFISVLDDLDSYKNPEEFSGMLVRFKNMINDHYSRDISMKLRDVFDAQRREGLLVCTVPPYGYTKDPNNKHKLVIDHKVAHNVREIYEMYLSGMGVIAIAKHLNSLGVLSPSMYKVKKGMFKANHQNCSPVWRPAAVRAILSNMTYAGSLEQKKVTTRNYKDRKTVVVKTDERIIVHNTHEPIITMKMYEKVQINFQKYKRTPKNKECVYLFSGFLRCADCKSSMIRNPKTVKGKQYVYYKCRTYNQKSHELCSHSQSIRHEILEEIVLIAIKTQIQTMANMEKVLESINQSEIVKYNKRQYYNDISFKNRAIDKKKSRLTGLYEDYKDGVLTKEEYLEMKSLYNKDIDGLKEQIVALEKESKALAELEAKNSEWLNEFLKYNKVAKLSRQILDALVDKIYISKDKTVTIDFLYQDKYKTTCDYIQNVLKKEGRYIDNDKYEDLASRNICETITG